MTCKARKYVNKTAETTDCLNPVEYGCLCRVHARQISEASLGFGVSKVKRIHLPNVTDQEITTSLTLYRAVKGVVTLKSRDPMTFLDSVLSFIGDNRHVTSGCIVNHVNGLKGGSGMTPAKVGAVLRVLNAQGKIVRRLTTEKTLLGRSKGSACYELL